MSGSFCVYVAGMSLKIHGDIMCPPECLRVGRAPNHCHAVALHPGMCVCVGAVCTRVLGNLIREDLMQEQGQLCGHATCIVTQGFTLSLMLFSHFLKFLLIFK